MIEGINKYRSEFSSNRSPKFANKQFGLGRKLNDDSKIRITGNTMDYL